MRKNLRIFLLSLLVVIFSAASVFALSIEELYEDEYESLALADTEGYNYRTRFVATLDGEGEAGDVVWEVTMENESDTWLKWKTDARDSKILVLEGVLPASDNYDHGYSVVAHVSGDIENPESEPDDYEGEEEWPATISGDVFTDASISVTVDSNPYTVGTFSDLVTIAPESGVDLNTMSSKYDVTVTSTTYEDDEGEEYDNVIFEEDTSLISIPSWLSFSITKRRSGDPRQFEIKYNSPLPRGDREAMVLVPAYPDDTSTYDNMVLVGWPVKYTAPSISLTKPSKTDISMKYGTTTTLSISYKTVKPVDVAFDTDKMKIVSWNKPTGTSGTLNIIVKPVALSGDVAAKLIVYDDNEKSADIDFKFSIAESIAVSPDVVTWNAAIEHATSQTLNLLTSERPVRYETSPEIPDNFNLMVISDDTSITLEVSPTSEATTYNGKITFYDADNDPAEVTLNIEPIEAILIKERGTDIKIPSSGIGDLEEDPGILHLLNDVLPVRYTAKPEAPANLYLEVLWGDEIDEERIINVRVDPSEPTAYEGVLTFYDENGYTDSVNLKVIKNMSTPSGTSSSFTTYPGEGTKAINLEVGDYFGNVSWTVEDGLPSGINAELLPETGPSTTLNVNIDEDFEGDFGDYSFEVIAEDEAGQQVTFTINITVDPIPTIKFGEYEPIVSLDARFSKDIKVSFDTVAPVLWDLAEESDSDIGSYVSFDVKWETSSADANAGNMIVTMAPITSEINTEADIKTDDFYEVILAVTDAKNQVVYFPLLVKIIVPSLILSEESVNLSAVAGSSGTSKTIALLADENSEYEAPITPVSYEFSGDEPDERFNFALTSDDSSITFSIKPSWPELTYDGTVMFVDAFGNSSTVDLELASTSAGEIGITSDIDVADLNVTAGQSSNITLTVNNAFGEVNWTIENVPEWLKVTPSSTTGNSVTFTIEADDGASGSYSFNIEAEDEAGNSATFTIKGEVNVPELTLSNLPGTITAIYGQTTTETFNFSGTTITGHKFTDDISENVEVSVEYPTALDSGNITLSITPVKMADETYSTTLAFSDAYGHEPKAELTIEVVVPKLVISEDEAEISANLGGSNSTSLNLTGTYKAAPISFEASPEIDEGFGFSVESNDTKITLIAQPTEPLEDYEGEITFNDAFEHSDTVNLKIHVVSEEPFSITQTRGENDITLNAEESTTIAFQANEPKGTVTWTARSSGVTITPATATGTTATFTITAGSSAVNNGSIQITATDGNTTVNATITVTVIAKEATTPDETNMNIESEDVVTNLLETLGVSDNNEVAELPVDDETIVSTKQRSASDVAGEVPSKETLKLVLPLITPKETKIYVFAIDRSKLRDLFKVGEEIFVHMTNKNTASASGFYASASEGAKLVDDYGKEIKTFPASGNINVAGLMQAGGSYSTIITSSAPEPQQPDDSQKPDDQEEPKETSDNVLESPSGTCNGGFGILALAVLGASLVFRKRISL